MARFRGTVKGTGGTASRLGGATLKVTALGWRSGVEVHAYVGRTGGPVPHPTDIFEIFGTKGSLDDSPPFPIGTLTIDKDGKVIFTVLTN